MMVFGLVMVRSLLIDRFTPEQFKALVDGDDMRAKVNYLIEERRATNAKGIMTWFWPLMILAIFLEPLLTWLRDHWYPRNVFYFGKEKNRYDLLVQRRSRWLWGVVIGFVISFLGSLAVWLFTKG